MAIRLIDEYPGRTNPETPENPDGSFKNETAPGAADGTPLERRWANDWQGFSDALLGSGQVVADGSLDIVSASQRLQALQNIIGAERTYTTKGEAIDNTNNGVVYIVIIELDDAPFGRIASNVPAGEKFQDAAGQFWGIRNTTYYNAQRVRWGIDNIENLPLFNTTTDPTRGYISRAGVISYAAQLALFNTLRNDVDTLQDEIQFTAGTGNAVTSVGNDGTEALSNTLSGVYPASGKMILMSAFMSRYRSSSLPASCTLRVSGENAVIGFGRGIGGNEYTTCVRSAFLFVGTPGDNTERTSTVTLVGDASLWQNRSHSTILIPV